MKGVVLDASLALEWFSADATPEVLASREIMTDHVALVPHLWRFEVMNVFATWRKKNLITEADSTWMIHDLMELPFATISEGSPESIIGLALKHNLTAYDATYLHAAMITGEPLASLDPALRRAAQEVGVNCI